MSFRPANTCILSPELNARILLSALFCANNTDLGGSIHCTLVAHVYLPIGGGEVLVVVPFLQQHSNLGGCHHRSLAGPGKVNFGHVTKIVSFRLVVVVVVVAV